VRSAAAGSDAKVTLGDGGSSKSGGMSCDAALMVLADAVETGAVEIGSETDEGFVGIRFCWHQVLLASGRSLRQLVRGSSKTPVFFSRFWMADQEAWSATAMVPLSAKHAARCWLQPHSSPEAALKRDRHRARASQS
jgi:hypothetical protein